MKQWIAAGLLSASVAGVGGYYASSNVKQRFIVSQKPGFGIQSAVGLEQAKKALMFGAMVGENPIIKDLQNHSAFVANLSAKKAKELQENFGVVVEQDQRMSIDFLTGCAPKRPNPGPPPPEPDERLQDTPWGIRAIDADKAWAHTKGRGIIVCVVDTGVEASHPDLNKNVIGGADFTGTGHYFDDNGHGTHVAGTVAAQDDGIGVVGVAPEASIFAAKVLDYEGAGWNSDIADGILECVNQGAHVINLSLGGSISTNIMRDAIMSAQQAGVVIVAAAGNDNTSKPSYPAAYDGVLAITAVDSDLKFASFSNFGGIMDIAFAAPGVDILSTVPGWKYDYFDGTSMASPHVAGVVALMLSSGRSQPKARSIGLSDDKQGQGLIDALKSVTE